MRGWQAAILAATALACSDLTAGTGGVVSLELRTPTDLTLEVGEQAQLRAVALNQQGDSVAAEITWLTPDTTVIVDPQTGLVTGRWPGIGRVQARSGSLASDLVQFSISAVADTLIVPQPATFDVAAGITESPPLAARIETKTPPGPLSGQNIVFQIVEPVFADPATRTVQLTGGVLADTLITGSDGSPNPPVAVQRVPGVLSPDSAIVEVSARRTSGTPVPGSGQRFIVRFH